MPIGITNHLVLNKAKIYNFKFIVRTRLLELIQAQGKYYLINKNKNKLLRVSVTTLLT